LPSGPPGCSERTRGVRAAGRSFSPFVNHPFPRGANGRRYKRGYFLSVAAVTPLHRPQLSCAGVHRGLGIMAPIWGCRSLLRRAAMASTGGNCRYQDSCSQFDVASPPARAAGKYRIDCRSSKTASRCCGHKTSDSCAFPAPRPTLGSFALSSQTCWRCFSDGGGAGGSVVGSFSGVWRILSTFPVR